MAARAARHPIWVILRIDVDHIRKYINGVKEGGVSSIAVR